MVKDLCVLYVADIGNFLSLHPNFPMFFPLISPPQTESAERKLS